MKAGKHLNLYPMEDYIKPNSIYAHLVTKIKLIKNTKIKYKQNDDPTKTMDIENEQSENLRMHG